MKQPLCVQLMTEDFFNNTEQLHVSLWQNLVLHHMFTNIFLVILVEQINP
jgi:hypothetical protein